ncbi:MAG: DUF1080 domain-containing protein [Acidobacteria bacterium]|nr:DUF1080 domain-containing protein [Acidobacteriota bacterium]
MKLIRALAILAATCHAESLFNGRNLDGWDGDPALWRVENGILIGDTSAKTLAANTFLILKKPYTDFHLTAEVKLRNGNSGIQFRSERAPGEGWIVTGYQADFSEDGDRSAWGNFYEEKGRGRNLMKTTDEGWRIAKPIYKQHDWNTVEIIARGPRMELKLNGTTTVVVTDEKSKTGVIALQLHRGPAMRVEFRKIEVRK